MSIGAHAYKRLGTDLEHLPAQLDLPPVGMLLLRGLRLKCGLDTGKVSASVHAALGRVSYR